MTDNEIINAANDCDSCVVFTIVDWDKNEHTDITLADLVGILNRQKANAEGLTNAVKYLNEQKAQLKAELEEEKRLVADIARDFAFHRVYELIPYSRNEVNFMSLNRVDKHGYHFTYTVLADNSKHQICVMQTDLR